MVKTTGRNQRNDRFIDEGIFIKFVLMKCALAYLIGDSDEILIKIRRKT